MVTSSQQSHLLAPKSAPDQRRASLGATKEETKIDIDEGWDPFDDDGDDDFGGDASNVSIFDDDFDPQPNRGQAQQQPRHTSPPIASGSASSNGDVSDPFFSEDFA